MDIREIIVRYIKNIKKNGVTVAETIRHSISKLLVLVLQKGVQ